MSVEDELKIQRSINLYGFAVDTQSWDLFDQVFTPDVDADYSETSHWRDRSTLKSDFEAYHLPFDGTQHAMMSHLVHVSGDEAWALTYATWRLIRKGLDGGDFWEGTGWYDDTLVRTGDGWRIKARTCRIIWWGGNPLVNETVPGVKFSLPMFALKAEREAGRVRYFNALTA
ncbi:MAG: nuclear transport factor 2 family protein [Pseudomonadota bacterium]